jgi:hypothetical protein
VVRIKKRIPLTRNEEVSNILPNLSKNSINASTQLFSGIPLLIFENK